MMDVIPNSSQSQEESWSSTAEQAVVVANSNPLSVFLSYIRPLINLLPFSFKNSSSSTFVARKPNPICSPLPESANLITEHYVLAVVSHVWNHTLFNLDAVQELLMFWLDIAKQQGALSEAESLLFADGNNAVTFNKYALKNCEVLCRRLHELSALRHSLAVLLSELHGAVHELGKSISTDYENSVASFLMDINSSLLRFEGSTLSSSIFLGSNYSYSSLIYDVQAPQPVNFKRHATGIIYWNLNEVDRFISLVVTKHAKPITSTRQWVPYAIGAIGVSVFSAWMLCRLSGTINNSLTAIRDAVFEPFRNMNKQVMEVKQMGQSTNCDLVDKSTSDSLNRLLLDFCEKTGQKCQEDGSIQERFGMAVRGYVKQLNAGTPTRSDFLVIMDLHHQIETIMPDFFNQRQIDKTKDHAIIAALRAHYRSIGVLFMSLSSWLVFNKHFSSTGGTLALCQRKLLLLEIEGRIKQQEQQMDMANGQFIDGMTLYTLDRLYRAVERPARETGEWPQVRREIIALGDPKISTKRKIGIISDLKNTLYMIA